MKYLFLAAIILSGSIMDASARTIPRPRDKEGNPLPCPAGYQNGANDTYCKPLTSKDLSSMGFVTSGGTNNNPVKGIPASKRR